MNERRFDMALTNAQVFERRKRVTSHLVRGCSPAEVAEILRVDVATVYNDMRVIRSGANPELSVHSVGEIFAQVLLNQRARTKALWREVDTGEASTVRMRALRELRLQDAALLRHAARIAGTLKPVEEQAGLTAEEAELISSLSLRAMKNRFEKPSASASEIRRLKDLFERLEEVHASSGSTTPARLPEPCGGQGGVVKEKFTNRLIAGDGLTPNPAPAVPAQLLESQKPGPPPEVARAAQTGKNTYDNL